jgi:hypothetical protein
VVLQFLSFWQLTPFEKVGAREVAQKLKYHRLKPGGVQKISAREVAQKLKYHRLKPGGVQKISAREVAQKLKYHRLKAWWCPKKISQSSQLLLILHLPQHQMLQECMMSGEARDANAG